MRIAVVGTGIAGNSAAWSLVTSTDHDVTIFEKEPRIGGHSATIDIVHQGRNIAVDTGFIVYNELNYPNFVALLAHLGVANEASDMGFSVSSGGGKAEWAGRATRILDGLFARRRNIISLGHFNMIREMFRFNAAALADLAANRLGTITIDEYLKRGKYSARFREEYLVPMGAAIWSMPPARLAQFPAASFLAFFQNHRLLHWNRPTWRTVTGGSRAYVEKLTAPFKDRIRQGVGVASIKRHDLGVVITDSAGNDEHFDHVIIAAHSDEALAMLPDASDAERDILGAIKYRPNDVWLHHDEALMPKRKAAWAAWNVLRANDPEADLTLTYWMNALQNIDRKHPVFVTLNPPVPPRADKVFGRFNYSHPQFDAGAVSAQGRLSEIQGQRHTWFCGAWTGYGFHEDGLKSGLAAAAALGASVPWQTATAAIPAE
ncbi:MAG: NAD(P)/FAD-dependent oxidoreductase [Bosea sp. (in: a-proteobacteria)]